MPKTIAGKLSALLLAVFCIQIIAFFTSAFSNNGFGALVNFIQLAPITALLGLFLGGVSTKKESGKSMIIPIITLIISIVFACFFFYLLLTWSFGG